MNTIKQQENHLFQINALLSTYKVLTFSQLKKAFPDITDKNLLLLLQRLEKKGRLCIDGTYGYVKYTKDCPINQALIKAFWVLLDFYPKVIHHAASDYPISLSFFTESNCYDVIYIPYEQEIQMNVALSTENAEFSNRIVIIDQTSQIDKIGISGVIAFCTISPSGEIQYYKPKENGTNG